MFWKEFMATLPSLTSQTPTTRPPYKTTGEIQPAVRLPSDRRSTGMT
jgi:hypothetical protein